SAVNTMQANAEQKQQCASPQDMPENLVPAAALGHSLIQRKGHRNAHNKHKERLDQVPEPKPVPWMMKELRNYCRSKGPFRKESCQGPVYQCRLGNQQKHGQSTVD